ncbi:hypothetical protein ACHAWF_001106, partial [Thalassiosira exigua]
MATAMLLLARCLLLSSPASSAAALALGGAGRGPPLAARASDRPVLPPRRAPEPRAGASSFAFASSDDGEGSSSSSAATVDGSDRLLSLLAADESDQDEGAVREEISSLEASFRASRDGAVADADDDEGRFDPLLGLYGVAAVLTRNPKDNPVGGKWTRKKGWAHRLFRTRTPYQHLLPCNSTGLSGGFEKEKDAAAEAAEKAVAEAVNVISLDALGGLFRIAVVLRGDATPLSSEELRSTNANRTDSSAAEADSLAPLSDLAVRANFDAPRIYLGRRKEQQ